MLELYKHAAEVFKKERKTDRRIGRYTIMKIYKINEYNARIVRAIADLFHEYGYTYEEIDGKLKALKKKYDVLNHKYNQLINESGNFEEIINLFKEYIEINPESINEIELFKVDNESTHMNSKSSIVLLISDWHIGEIVEPESVGFINEFNLDVAKQRIKNLFTKISKIVNMQRIYENIDTIYVAAIGDMVSGINLHNELDKTNELNIAEQVIECSNLLVNLLLSLKSLFNKIIFIGVPGNHGRATKKKEFKDPSNSFDYLVYKMVEMKINTIDEYISDEINIQFKIPKSFFHIEDINGYKFLFSHGDNIKSWSSIPFYGMIRDYNNKQEVFQSTFNHPIHYLCIGHFHQPITINRPLGGIIVNGTIKGVCEYAFANNYISKPSQTILGVNEKYGKTFLYELYV